MKILILIPGLPPNLNNIKGGIHSALINLLHGFKTLSDTEVRVVSFLKQKSKEAPLQFADNVTIYYENEGPFPFHSINYFIFGSAILKSHIKAFKPEIVHSQVGNTFAFVKLFVRLKCPFVLTIHGMSNEEAKRKNKISDKIIWRFNSFINSILIPKNIIHLSQFSKSKTSHFKFNHEVIIHNSVPIKYFNIPLKNKTDNILMYIGVIDNNKNLIFLLNILKKLKALNVVYKLEVLGDFSNDLVKTQIENFIQKNELTNDVVFHGWLLQQDVMRIISNSDILVVSSKHESLPMVIAESMASGKVVVASDVGGIPEMIVNDVDGFVFNLSYENQIMAPLSDLHNNFNKMESIALNARKSAFEKFNCEKVAERTLLFYKKIS